MRARRFLRRSAAPAAAMIVLSTMTSASAYPPPGRHDLVSLRADGTAAADASSRPSISADGRFVAFEAHDALVPEDANGISDIYVRDRRDGVTELVSIGADGQPANGASFMPGISADGRMVVFNSLATNLGAPDEDGQPRAFVHDRATGVTEVASVDGDGDQVRVAWPIPNHISGDGRFVVFTSVEELVPEDGNPSSDIYIRDLVARRTEIVSLADDDSPANHGSNFGAPSFDGRYVVFMSAASNLVEGDTNGERNSQAGWDIFVRDRHAGTTVRASVASNGQQANDLSYDAKISADGTIVAFRSMASNLVPADDNAGWDVFVRDLSAGRTQRVSVTSDGVQGNTIDPIGDFSLSLSPDGRYVAFAAWSSAMLTNDDVPYPVSLFDPFEHRVFVHDRASSTTELIAVADDGRPADGHSVWPSISSDGRYVAFASSANDVVPAQAGRCPHSSEESECQAVIVRDRGPDAGPAEIDVAFQGGELRVEGWARLAGAVVAAAGDPTGDGGALAEHVGGELTRAELLDRPEAEDVLVSMDVANLPGLRSEIGGWPADTSESFLLWSGTNVWCHVCSPPGKAMPLVVYRLRFAWNGMVHEARAERVGAAGKAPSFTLHRCEPGCEKVAELRGSLGTIGETIRISIPRSVLPPVAGPVTVSSIAATTEVMAGPQRIPVDALDLGSAELRVPSAALGIAAAGSAVEQVSFDAPADLSDGRFNGSIAAEEGAAGSYDVWVRICSATCVAGSTSVEAPG